MVEPNTDTWSHFGIIFFVLGQPFNRPCDNKSIQSRPDYLYEWAPVRRGATRHWDKRKGVEYRFALFD
jgi:hypothetical protein